MPDADNPQPRNEPSRVRGRPLPWMGDAERADASIPVVPPEQCPRCRAILPASTRMWRLRVCPSCHFHMPIPARDRITTLVDDGTFRELDNELASLDPLRFTDDRPYSARLRHQQARHRQKDALVTGTARIGGHPVVLAVLEFTFMGGSMGLVVGELLAAAAEHAVAGRRPLITMVASGGARMQEGMFALWQMARTAAAIKRLRSAGVPYISVLTNPTTGGVFASFASLGDLILAEPDALIGFAGPRVAEAMTGTPLPEGSHRAEDLFRHGHIDAIVDRPDLRRSILNTLSIWAAAIGLDEQDVRPVAPWQADPETPLPDPWTLVTEARQSARPSSHAYIQQIVADFQPLGGDRLSGDDPAVIGGFGRIGELPAMVIGLDRGFDRCPDRAPLQPRPAGFRKAQRLMTLAARWRLPVVMMVDTPGAWPGVDAERQGLAGAIAQNLALLSDLPTPTVSITIGEGGSGGALALAVADRMLIQERAVFSVIAPEGAASILYRDPGRAEELARSLRLTARDLLRFGMVDGIIREPEGGAGTDIDLAATLVERAIVAMLDELRRYDGRHLVTQRYERIRNIGEESVQRPSRSRRASRWLRRRLTRDRDDRKSGGE